MTRTLAVMALVIAVLVKATQAQPTDPDTAARQMLIAVRVLSYDKSLSERATQQAVTIALVSSATSEGRAARRRFVAAFSLMPKLKVGGKAIRVVSVEVSARKTFEPALVAQSPSLVIVVDDLGEQRAILRQVARARSVLTVSLRETDVANGIAVGVVQTSERNEILVNIEEARAEGVRFGAGLLQLARLVDGS